MYPLKLGQTAQPLIFLMVSATDHLSGATGLSPAVTLSKNGGAFAAPAGAVSEIGNGWYKVAGNAADAAALGPLILHATAAGADPTDSRYDVVAFDPQSATGLGLSNLDAAVSSRSTYAGGPVAGVTGNVGGSVASVVNLAPVPVPVGTVTAVASGTAFTATGLNAAAGAYNPTAKRTRAVLWLTGANASETNTVASYAGAGTFTLDVAPTSTPANGDTFIVL